MKTTKEQLQIELTETKTKYQERLDYLERVRREFAKIFNWGEKKGGMYDYDKKWEWTTPSWELIFTEVGRLLEKRDYRDMSDRLNRVEQDLFELTEKIKKEIHPNL
jgi:predicted nuclease with TOPRIM domain